MQAVVVIPAYNEADSIGQVIDGLVKLNYKVMVVDDGSSDNTYKIASSHNATVLRHVINRGYGAALRTGTDYAFSKGAEVVVHFDADGQFEPLEINKFLEAIAQGAEIVLGSRFLGQHINMPFSRLLTLKMGIIFTWFVSGIKLTDAHNGFRAFTKKAWQSMHLILDQMAFSSEVIDEIARLKIKYQEIPVTVRYTPYSWQNSKQGNWAAFKVVKDFFMGKIIK